MVDAVKAQKAGDLARAELLCRQALTMAEQVVPRDMRVPRSYVLLGIIQRSRRQIDQAQASLEFAVSAGAAIVGELHPDLIRPLESLANFYHDERVDYPRVAELQRRVLAIVEGVPQPDSREVAQRARNLATTYQLAGRYADAEAFFRKALQLAERNGFDVAQYQLDFAAFYGSWNRCTEAQKLAQRAVALRDLETRSKDAGVSLDLALGLAALARIYSKCGRLNDSAIAFERALALMQRVHGDEGVDLVPHWLGLATVEHARGRHAHAERLCRQALRVAEKEMGPEALDTVPALEECGRLLETLHPAEARALQERARRIRNSASGLLRPIPTSTHFKLE